MLCLGLAIEFAGSVYLPGGFVLACSSVEFAALVAYSSLFVLSIVFLCYLFTHCSASSCLAVRASTRFFFVSFEELASLFVGLFVWLIGLFDCWLAPPNFSLIVYSIVKR